MQKNNGKFVISLDFEIAWGVRTRSPEAFDAYRPNLLGVQTVIPRTLQLFEKFGIAGTFATVGFLFFRDKSSLMAGLPERKPSYTNNIYSPYGAYLDGIGEDAKADPYHFAPHLLDMIIGSPLQEVSSHTFSHYFCLEKGQTVEDFRADLEAASTAAATKGLKMTSIIFPRNQFNESYLQACASAGIIAYRNNEHSWVYDARSREAESLTRRSLRLIDAYLNLTGHHCYSHEYIASEYPLNIPSSRFLRPYSSKLKLLDWLRLRRIKKAMTYAAKNKLVYHLWWHPHNFGINQDQNFAFLEKILQHYAILKEQYGFTSITMTGLAHQLLEKNGQ